ncbi:hypothetical protein B7494_g3969 [Chlorociboria aeruginascens]|nr:hypothetical protein B7494_g3969 [Chlorociboria aeruginascens]
MAAAVPTQPHNLPIFTTTETCSSKIYIVTGANKGLGFEAAKHLVALGAANVTLGVRNVTTGEAATRASKITEVWALNLSSYNSVKASAKKAIAELDYIDALLENAGVVIFEKVLAKGHLESITVNVLSTFLLAVLLLSKMRQDAQRFAIQPHLVVVASRLGFNGVDTWNQITDNPIVRMDNEEMAVVRSGSSTHDFAPCSLRQELSLPQFVLDFA